MDIAAWLRGLGLEQYAPAFRDNEVDGDVLPDLTAEDLIGLGVTPVGHPRKLLSAIAALGVAAPAPALTRHRHRRRLPRRRQPRPSAAS
jgi:SAM (Sterile alpha motif) domain-containing protein